jgi:enoyl-CoA hydratase
MARNVWPETEFLQGSADIDAHTRYDGIIMDIRFDRQGALAIVTLDRPQALNALTLEMTQELDRRLAAWAADPAVAAVMIRSTGGRAFCAGGDIRALYEAGRRKEPYAADFYRCEYRLNHRIKTFPKSYIALIDGIVMGGGVGLSVHGSHRVVTERCRFAMPETGIGFFPDVGGSWFLPRCPGSLGIYLGLTGARLGAADMIYCGLATHHVRSEDLAGLMELLEGAEVDAALARWGSNPGPAPIAQHREAVDRCFDADSVEEILARLGTEGTAWAAETAAELRRKSPTSLKVTLRQLRIGAQAENFAAVMRMEYRLARRFMSGSDFYEGVRAAVIDKDQAPRWRPATLAEVTEEEVARYFAPLDEPELELGDG